MSMNSMNEFIDSCLQSAASTMQSLQNTLQEKQEEKWNLCRFCAVVIKNGCAIDLLKNTVVLHEYLHMIEVLKIDYLNFNHLKLPKTICIECHSNFKTAYNFFNRVRVSQTHLNVLYCDNVEIFKCDDVNKEPIDNRLIYEDEPNILKFEDNEDDTVFDNTETTTSLLSKDMINEEELSLDEKVPLKNVQATLETQLLSKDIDALESLTLTRMGNHNISSTKLPILRKNVIVNAKKSLLQNSPDRTLIVKYENTSDSLHDVKDIEFDNLTDENLKSNKNVLEIPENNKSIVIFTQSSRNLTNNEEIYHIRAEKSPEHCMVSVLDSDTPVEAEGSDISWTSYPWACKHCTEEFKNMAEVREHSKIVHGVCYGYHCADCIDQFNMFNAFIEHIRQHRDDLRYYCQFCNLRCDSEEKCSEHALSHWTNHKICGLCGEMLKDADALRSHRAAYKRATLPRRDYRKRPRLVTPSFIYNGVPTFDTQGWSWHNYEWTCLECCMRLSSVESLRAHARDFHETCFAMKCADCLKVVSNYRMFVAHVTAHRPYLKNYCQFCNEHFETYADQNKHVNDHMTGPQKPCDGCGQIFENKALLFEHLRKYDPPRIRGTLTTEDLACNVCAKTFKTRGSYRSHLKTHAEKRKRDHICDTCGKGFYNASTLRSHVVVHSEVKSNVCELCKKEFKTKLKLRAHVLTHLEKVSTFTCDECGKSFRKKQTLKYHIYSHMDIKLFKCLVCSKEFRNKGQVNIHMNQHTGSRPYSCKHCDKTFTNWSNCNKHMLRKHGDTLAKTKLTSQGRLDVNKETGTVEALRTDKRAEQWVNEIMKRDKGPLETDKKYIFKTA